jgi:hypothetical protein
MEPELSGTAGQKSPRPWRWLRIARWLLVGTAVLLLVAYVSTAVHGVQAVQQAIHAEATADYRSLKARAPRAVNAGFGGPEFAACRAIFPGIVYCRYHVTLGPLAASGWEALYFWDGSSCQRLWSKMLWVS